MAARNERWAPVSQTLDRPGVFASIAAEEIIVSGRVRVHATRSDHPGSTIPEPVEKLLAAATRVEIVGDVLIVHYEPGQDIQSILVPRSNLRNEAPIAWHYGKAACSVVCRAARVHESDLNEALAAAGYAVLGKQIKHIAWDIAKGILDRGKAPLRGYGRLIRLARMVNTELDRRGHRYENGTVRKMISLDLRNWEAVNPDK